VKKSGMAMDWQKIAGFLGSGSQVFATATSASILIGAIYTIDCRIMAGADHQKAMQCYISGLPMMGLGVAGKAGYNTFNPRLHPASNEERPRDSSGRFTKRKKEEDEQR
jgi:hypothetical protein